VQDYSDFQPPPGQPPASGGVGKAILWIAVGLGACILLPCCGFLGWAAYLGAYGPETSVYTGNEVPARFMKVMKTVGALENGETILYFYSDAMADIRDGFYFVSDRGVAVYSDVTGEEPLIKIPFDQIVDAELTRDESFFVDSEITLELKDGRPVSFPVSSEGDKDERFFEAIQNGMSRAAGPAQAERED
jgi:hypothetical protein